MLNQKREEKKKKKKKREREKRSKWRQDLHTTYVELGKLNSNKNEVTLRFCHGYKQRTLFFHFVVSYNAMRKKRDFNFDKTKHQQKGKNENLNILTRTLQHGLMTGGREILPSITKLLDNTYIATGKRCNQRNLDVKFMYICHTERCFFTKEPSIRS